MDTLLIVILVLFLVGGGLGYLVGAGSACGLLTCPRSRPLGKKPPAACCEASL